MGSAMETIYTFFLNYEQYIILLTICFFAGMAWRHHRLISRLFIIAASCLWVIYVYRYQIAVGWPALDASGELSLRELFSDGAFIRHWFYLLSAASLGGALGVAFDDTRSNQARARYGLRYGRIGEPPALACSRGLPRPTSGGPDRLAANAIRDERPRPTRRG